MDKPNLKTVDPTVYDIIQAEQEKQQHTLALIPSENFASKAIREAVGSVLMNKYSEGYPGARYYEGNQHIDDLEELVRERARKAFGLDDSWGVNTQALSGSAANLAVYIGLLKPGDTVLGMYLPDGGHLSHGWSYEPKTEQDPQELTYLGGKRKVNVTSKFYKTVQYKTNPETQMFDYDEVERIALEHKPKLIITGGTAYPREVDYKRMREIADKVGAYYLADIAHEAGLVAAGAMDNPFEYADVVTFTTHKTFRANRGALILSKEELSKKIDRAVFPGLQGGPHNHSIAGIAVGLQEILTPEFKEYAKAVVENAQTLAKELEDLGFSIVSGGTDKHLVLIDLTNKPVAGKKFARALAHAGIIANMNTMPQEKRSPADPSALRIGTPTITTRGMGTEEMKTIANLMNRVMGALDDYKDLSFEEFDEAIATDKEVVAVAKDVMELCKKFPLDI